MDDMDPEAEKARADAIRENLQVDVELAWTVMLLRDREKQLGRRARDLQVSD